MTGLVAVMAALTAVTSPAQRSDDNGRRFEVRDSVEMSYFGVLPTAHPEDLDDDGIESPDGHYLVKVTHRGVLPQGYTEGTIWLFDAKAIRRSMRNPAVAVPKPTPLVRLSAAINGCSNVSFDRGNTISSLKWAEDSRSLTFLGRDGRENWQLFRVNLTSHAVKSLTAPTQNVMDYAWSGETFAYLAGPDAHEEQRWWSVGPGIPDVVAGTRQSLFSLVYPHLNYSDWALPMAVEIWVVRNDIAAPVIDASSGQPLRLVTKYTTRTLALSSDGMRLATIAYDAPPRGHVRREDLPELDRTLRYRIVDLSRGSTAPVIDAPIVDVNFDGDAPGRYRAAWSPDGEEIALTATSVPSDRSAAPTSEPRPCTVAVVTLATRRAHCSVVHSDPRHEVLYGLQWSPDGQRITLRYHQHFLYLYTEEVLLRKGLDWVPTGPPPRPVNASLQLIINEGMNNPPVLQATDPSTGRRKAIFDPNPQLAKIALGSVEVYAWHDSHDRTIQGGLVKPPDYNAHKRYPLVIQTHGFNPFRLYTTGGSETSNAGRALAGRDLLVLQVGEPHAPYAGTWEEGMENGTKVYVAAIDKLARDGLVDPKRVGISGYSASGLRVAFAITRAADRFAAAAISNTVSGSLTEYYNTIDGDSASIEGLRAVIADAKPYGEGLQKWIERAPGFSFDKIQAPVLVSAADPLHLINLWPLYAALRDQNKPVDLQYFRDGAHNITKPLQRLAHQEALVDWFDFWLNGHEDPAPRKASQYGRWRDLRALPRHLDSATQP